MGIARWYLAGFGNFWILSAKRYGTVTRRAKERRKWAKVCLSFVVGVTKAVGNYRMTGNSVGCVSYVPARGVDVHLWMTDFRQLRCDFACASEYCC